MPSLCLFERCNGGALDLNLGLFRHHYRSCRSFSSSSFEKPQCGTGNLNVFKPNATSNQFWDIINIIRGNREDLESKLDSLNVDLTNALVVQIFRALNDHDYEGILPVLIEFRRNGIDLNHKAFGFLLVQLPNEDSIKISVERLVRLLNEVGGSCRISGFMALIEMFCSLGSFAMAKFVIQITERRASFFNIIVREQCRRNDSEGARCTLDEMRQVNCSPDVGILNYLLSSLCKNDKFDEAHNLFEEMLERDCPPNSLTFEVIICHLCKIGNIESALGFLDMMVSRGLKPRLSTHTAFVRSYFNSQRYEEAYRYAVDSSLKHAMAQNSTYSLLATLHEKRGNLVDAQKILSELIDAGLRPNFPVYMRVLKKLQHQGKEDLANDLKGKLSNVSLQSGIQTG